MGHPTGNAEGKEQCAVIHHAIGAPSLGKTLAWPPTGTRIHTRLALYMSNPQAASSFPGRAHACPDATQAREDTPLTWPALSFLHVPPSPSFSFFLVLFISPLISSHLASTPALSNSSFILTFLSPSTLPHPTAPSRLPSGSLPWTRTRD